MRLNSIFGFILFLLTYSTSSNANLLENGLHTHQENSNIIANTFLVNNNTSKAIGIVDKSTGRILALITVFTASENTNQTYTASGPSWEENTDCQFKGTVEFKENSFIIQNDSNFSLDGCDKEKVLGTYSL